MPGQAAVPNDIHPLYTMEGSCAPMRLRWRAF